ncbi:MAG: metallophosphoesterase [Candidatus Woesearchaeota archaeon]
MRILAFTDMHGDLSSLKSIKKKARNADVVVCCGDLTILGQHLSYLLLELNRLGKPVFIVHGNHEGESAMRKAGSLFSRIHYLHRDYFVYGDVVFLGYGGGGFSMHDAGFEKDAEKLFGAMKKAESSVLILHGPPYGVKQDRIMNGHCGNKSYTKFIREKKPNYVFCGHIHENNGTIDKIEDSIICNPGHKGKLINL